MTLTNGQIINLYQGLRAARSVVFPLQITRAMLKNLGVTEPIYKEAYDFSQTLGEPLETNEKWLKYLNQSQVIELSLVSWDDIAEMNISMEALEALMPMISGEE